MTRGDQWLHYFYSKAEEDPTVPGSEMNERRGSCRFYHRGISLSLAGAAKSDDEKSRIRKLTSLSYLGGKLRCIFHREHRDTIVCEEDEEGAGGKCQVYNVIRISESRVQSSASFDSLVSALPSVNSMDFARSASVPTKSHKPSKEQRWCTNCAKCFQRGLSQYDQYCGLDCKTAHRMRQIA